MEQREVKIYMTSLMNEISAQTYKSAKTYIGGDKPEERAEAQVGADALDLNFCLLKVEEGMKKVADLLHKYVIDWYRSIDDMRGKDADNKLKTGMRERGTYWVLTLGRMPEGRHGVTNGDIAREVHKYLVLNVLQEWAPITVPSLTNEYVERFAAQEERLKKVVYRKEEPDWNEGL